MFNRDPYRSKIYYTDNRRSRPVLLQIAGYISWGWVGVFVVLLGFFGFVLVQEQQSWLTPGIIGFVVVGWVFSLCLHEFGHAATAYLGGDHSDSTISYLSFNPFKYLHPVLSIVLPLVFILLGFIGLPGGAVYLRRDLVRSRGWQSMISLAGPLMNLLVLVVIGALFLTGVLNSHVELLIALAVLAFFQAAAIILNLLPIPGLDGFGVIQPWLSYEAQRAVMPFYNYGYLILFALLWLVPTVNVLYFTAVEGLMTLVRIDPGLAGLGLSVFPHLR